MSELPTTNLHPLVESLTPREHDILALLSQNLSDREIAQKLILALSSVKWYARQIYAKLGVDNRREAVVKAGELGLLEPRAKTSLPTHNLPRQLTSFIGRKKEITRVVELVLKSPLVTLTGSGGVGKTRLALMAAAELLDDFPDGIWLIELAALSDPKLVPQTVIAVLGVNEQSDKTPHKLLADYLKPKRLLLILDNCEHLVAACTDLAYWLLRGAPRLKILATSREILGVEGEIHYRVPPMTMPGSRRLPPPDELAEFDAVRLFVERALGASPDFVLSEQNAAAVTRLCHRLDGIPLAIELAAARARLLTVDQIGSRLDDAFHLLTRGSRTALPRQQTLKAAIDWSYDLLSSQERLMLQRLAVFAGSWSLEGAEAVCAGDGIAPFEVLDLLAGLVDKSLAQIISSPDHSGRISTSSGAPPSGEMRYRMLETVRQYALDRLAETGGEEVVRDRHLCYYLQIGEQAGEELRGRLQLAWIAFLEDELDNLRLALDWSQDRNLESGLRLASALMWFWHFHDRDTEGAGWVNRLLEIEVSGRVGQPLAVGTQSDTYLLVLIRALNAMVFLCYFSPDVFSIDPAKSLLEVSIPLCRVLGDSAGRELANGLMLSGFYLHLSVDESLLAYQECLEICQRHHYHFEEAEGLYYWGCVEPDPRTAAGLLETSLEIFRAMEDPDAIAAGAMVLSRALFNLEEYTRARFLIAESLVYYRMVGNSSGLCTALISQYEMFPIPNNALQAEEALAYIREHPITDHMVEFCNLVLVEWSVGNYNRAESLAQEALAAGLMAEGLFDKYYPHLLLNRIALSQGDLDQARHHLMLVVSSIKDDHEIRHWFWGEPLGPIAVFLAANGQIAQAAVVFSAIEERLGKLEKNFRMPQRMINEHDSGMVAVREALGEEAFAQAWKTGQAMTFWQAFEYGRTAVLGA